MESKLQSVYDYISDHPIEVSVVVLSAIALYFQVRGTGELKKAIVGRSL